MELVGVISIISSAIVAIAAIGGLVYTYLKELFELKSRLTVVETKLEPFWKIISENLIDYLLQIKKGNPDGRREELLLKLRAGTITQSETQELETILRRELSEARQRGDTATVIAIIFLLGFIAALLAALARR
jgi:hypothetical protein